MKKRSPAPNVLPGFGLTMGYTVVYLSLIALIPLSTLILKTAGMGWARFWHVVASPRVVAAYELSIGASLAGATDQFDLRDAGGVDARALSLFRQIDRRRAGRFAVRAADLGRWDNADRGLFAPTDGSGGCSRLLGIKVAFTPLGVIVALTFIGLPFVVRTVQPVLQELEPELEEAAATLGASRLQTFRRVIGPVLLPALLTGFALAFARALGEYGSVVFISGNMPMRTEVVPLLIMTELEQFDYQAATAIALVMLLMSFAMLFLINLLQRWSARRHAVR